MFLIKKTYNKTSNVLVWPSTPSRYCLVILPLYTNKFRHIRNQCVSSLFGDRAFIDNAERLLLSYQSVYAEARIYTRQFG